MPSPQLAKSFCLAYVDEIPDDARQEDDEGIDHALDQRQRHHVAVADVADFVRQHRLDFFLAHALQQAGGYSDQGVIAARPGGEGIRRAFVDGDLGHGNAGLLRKALDGLEQPELG